MRSLIQITKALGIAFRRIRGLLNLFVHIVKSLVTLLCS